jgi:hypothetical protein
MFRSCEIHVDDFNFETIQGFFFISLVPRIFGLNAMTISKIQLQECLEEVRWVAIHSKTHILSSLSCYVYTQKLEV